MCRGWVSGGGESRLFEFVEIAAEKRTRDLRGQNRRFVLRRPTVKGCRPSDERREGLRELYLWAGEAREMAEGAGRGAYDEPGRGAGYGGPVYGPPGDLGTSWISVLIGWLAAVGASVILISIVSGVVGGILGTGGSAGSAGTVFAVGVLIALFIAFFIGGYAAGRMASRSGAKHGLMVALVALIVSILLALAGTAVGYALADDFSGVVIPGVPSIVPQGLNTVLTLSSVLALILPFVAGAIGGSQGARTGSRRAAGGY